MNWDFFCDLGTKNKSDMLISDFIFTLILKLNYSATFVESQQAFTESLQACACSLSQQALTESLQACVCSLSQQALTESQTASTVSAFLAALFPQEAKDTAANATNKNTNFFIFFAF